MINIQQNNDVYVISFPYDQNIVALVKNVPGRKWLAESKVWTIPKDRLGFLINQFQGTKYESILNVISEEHINENATIDKTINIPNTDISDVDFQVKEGSTPYQHQLDFMKWSIDRQNNGNLSGFIVADEMGCVSGDTKVPTIFGINGHNEVNISIRELYKLWSYKFVKFSKVCVKCKTEYKLDEFGSVSGFMYPCAIDILYSGDKEVYELVLRNGYSIKATPDHEILTSNGYVEMHNLHIDDEVIIDFENHLGTSKVESVTPIGIEDTYDIKMPDPDHNFIANGIVVHNCGKTIESMNLALYNRKKYEYKHCLIICCINSSKYNWLNDIITHTNEKEVPYLLGSRKLRNGTIKYDKGGKEKWEDLCNGTMFGEKDGTPLPYFLVLNIESLRFKQDNQFVISDAIISYINSGQINMVILDEIHKNASPKSDQGKQLLRIKKYTDKNCMWIPMTGTPITKEPMDVFTPLKLCDGHNFKSFYTWCQYFCVYGGFGDYQVIGYKNIPKLKDLLQNNMIRRLKEDILDLPPKIHYTEYVENSAYQKSLYTKVLTDLLSKKEELLSNPNPMAKLLKLRQVNGSPELVDNELVVDDDYPKKNARLVRLMELLDAAHERGEKTVVFSNWVEPLKTLYKFISKKYKTCVFTGTMSSEDREKHKRVFTNNPEYTVLLGTIGAAGTSHTFTVARNVIFYDDPWNPSDKEQAEDRCVVEGTKITTTRGFIPIENVTVGDYVYTYTGNVRKVTDCWNHAETTELVEIRFYGNPEPIILTSDHLVLTKSGWKQAGNLRHASDDELCEDITECMIPISDDIPPLKSIQTGFNFELEMYQYNQFGVRQLNGRKHSIPEQLDITDDFLFFCGYYLGDGCATKPDRNGSGQVILAGNTSNKLSSLNRCKSWFESNFSGKTKLYLGRRGNGAELYLTNKSFNKFIINNFGRTHEDKKFPDWIYKLNKHQLQVFMDGLLASDGCTMFTPSKQIYYTTVTPSLASGVWWLGSVLGHKPRIEFRNKSKQNPNHKDYYNVIYTEDNTYKLKTGRIRSIRKFTDTVTLYDITVDTDNSFYSWGTPLHNCHRIGATESINVFTLVAKDTVDERVEKILNTKSGISKYIVDGKIDLKKNPDLLDLLLGKS